MDGPHKQTRARRVLCLPTGSQSGLLHTCVRTAACSIRARGTQTITARFQGPILPLAVQALNSLFYALVTLATAAMLVFTIKTSLKEQPRHGRLIAGIPSGQPENDEMPVRDHVNALAISTVGSMGGQQGVVQHEGEGSPGTPSAESQDFAANSQLASPDASFVHLELADAPVPGAAHHSSSGGQIEGVPVAHTLLVHDRTVAGGTQLYVSPVPPYQVYAAVPTVGLALAPPAPADPDGDISRTSRSLSGFSLDLNKNSVISSVHASMAGPVAESVTDAGADAYSAPAVTAVPDSEAVAEDGGGTAPAAEDGAEKEQAEQQPQPPRDPKYDELYGSRLRARQTTIVKMLLSYSKRTRTADVGVYCGVGGFQQPALSRWAWLDRSGLYCKGRSLTLPGKTCRRLPERVPPASPSYATALALPCPCHTTMCTHVGGTSTYGTLAAPR